MCVMWWFAWLALAKAIAFAFDVLLVKASWCEDIQSIANMRQQMSSISIESDTIEPYTRAFIAHNTPQVWEHAHDIVDSS